jgi:hypothetical protein
MPLPAILAGIGAIGSKIPWGKIFGKNGIDPTTALLGGMSLFGGDEEQFQKRQSYAGTTADPVRGLTESMDVIKSLTNALASRGSRRLSGGGVKTAEPINIEGLPFQIGGGLGMDPATLDPSILEGRDNSGLGELFQHVLQWQGAPPPGGPTAQPRSVRQRSPKVEDSF